MSKTCIIIITSSKSIAQLNENVQRQYETLQTVYITLYNEYYRESTFIRDMNHIHLLQVL